MGHGRSLQQEICTERLRVNPWREDGQISSVGGNWEGLRMGEVGDGALAPDEHEGDEIVLQRRGSAGEPSGGVTCRSGGGDESVAGEILVEVAGGRERIRGMTNSRVAFVISTEGQGIFGK